MENLTILEEAANITDIKEDAYGTPKEHFTLVASLWSKYIGWEVTPTQVIGCMILLKLARELNSHRRDNLVDIAGYASILNRIS